MDEIQKMCETVIKYGIVDRADAARALNVLFREPKLVEYMFESRAKATLSDFEKKAKITYKPDQIHDDLVLLDEAIKRDEEFVAKMKLNIGDSNNKVIIDAAQLLDRMTLDLVGNGQPYEIVNPDKPNSKMDVLDFLFKLRTKVLTPEEAEANAFRKKISEIRKQIETNDLAQKNLESRKAKFIKETKFFKRRHGKGKKKIVEMDNQLARVLLNGITLRNQLVELLDEANKKGIIE